MHLRVTNASSVIKGMKKVFTTHGIPDILVSDNGPQFKCHEFVDFCREHDIIHRTRSPGFPQSNGEAESAVKIAKKILEQQDPEIALLNYRATPHSSTGVSPSTALMGRQIRTKLPMLPENLKPKVSQDKKIRGHDQKMKHTYKDNYDRRHGVVSLSPLKPGDSVLTKADDEKRWKEKG